MQIIERKDICHKVSSVSLSTCSLDPSEFKWPVSLLCKRISRVIRQDVGTISTVCLLVYRNVFLYQVLVTS